jgi:broad specificity phosphatase PhoE
MSTFFVIRHADKENGDFYNPQLRHQDQPISTKGRLEAHRLAAFFSGKTIEAIYTSEYRRTGQTIAFVAQERQLTPIIDARLNEIDNGLIDGLADEEIQQRYPETWRGYNERKADFRFPEGETGAEAQKRIVDFLEEKRQQNNSSDIILVSHDGLIRLLMCYLMGIPVYKRWNFQVDTCGIMEISYQPEYQEWKLIRFNQVVSYS